MQSVIEILVVQLHLHEVVKKMMLLREMYSEK